MRYHAIPVLLLSAAPLAAQEPSRLERGVLEETNLARTNPKAYAEHLEVMLSWFQGDVMFKPGSTVGLRTKEGCRRGRLHIAPACQSSLASWAL